MRFRVVGSSRETGGRMELEIEADSKGAAEREAARRGMDVRHAFALDDGQDASGIGLVRRPPPGGLRRLILLLLILLIVLGISYYWISTR